MREICSGVGFAANAVSTVLYSGRKPIRLRAAILTILHVLAVTEVSTTKEKFCI